MLCNRQVSFKCCGQAAARGCLSRGCRDLQRENLRLGLGRECLCACTQVKQATKMTGMLKSMMGKQPQWPSLPWHVTDAAAMLPADHGKYAQGEHTR